jgi:hypothetical protein
MKALIKQPIFKSSVLKFICDINLANKRLMSVQNVSEVLLFLDMESVVFNGASGMAI